MKLQVLPHARESFLFSKRPYTLNYKATDNVSPTINEGVITGL